MVSSSSRPLRLRMRPDVSIQKQQYQGRDYWLIKDPISLKYYRFEEEEYALLKMLDGRRTPSQIKRDFDYRYAPQKLTLQELFQFVGQLYRSCLLLSDDSNQGAELRKRGVDNRRRQVWASLSNILAIRFRGFDPDHWLTAINRWTWWFFTWPCFVLVLLLGVAATGLLIGQFDQFQNRLPSFQEFFASSNWIWLALVMAWTKMVHEFGHGLACKRFGSQCHEIGVMLLVLTPCLYCNVSDSWMLPSKWKRALIAAAGMYVELVMASLAVFLWWFTQPGLVNQLALNTIFVCSVSTLLFNANPLLRYDGYYILSDLMEIPNLRQKASTLLQRISGQWLLGIESPDDPFLPTRRRWFFVVYAIAAAVYRWFITFAIFWFLYQLLEPYGFKIVGQAIAMMAIYGLLGIPLIKLWKYFSVPGRTGMVKPTRIAISGVAVGLVLFCILLIPVPRFVYCSFYVEPIEVENIYVDIPGELASIEVQPNQPVRQDQPIIRLTSRRLDNEVRDIQDEQRITLIRLATYQRAAQTHSDEAAGAAEQQQMLETQLATTRRRLAQRESDAERLILRSPLDGWLLAPVPVEPQEPDADSLSQWDGTPLDPKNIGAFLDGKTLVARIVRDPSHCEAHLAVDQSEIEFIHPDAPVELLFDHLPGLTLHSLTRQISPSELTAIPKQLSTHYGGDLLSSTNLDGTLRPQSAHYLVRVPLESAGDAVLIGTTGRAKIRAGSQTVGYRVWRMMMQTFRFKL